MPLITVEVPGLSLNNVQDLTVPFLVDLTNWHNASSTSRRSEQREYGMGLYPDDDPAEEGRYPVIYGELRSLNDDDVWPLREIVMSLKNLESFELAVTDPAGLWRSKVAVSGQIQFDLISEGWCRFEIPLEADDPRKYGPALSGVTGVPTAGVGVASPVVSPFRQGASGGLGRVTVVNSGCAPTDPVVRVTGGLSEGFDVVCVETAQRVSVTRPILDGSSVRVDMGTGTAWIDDVSPLSAAYLPVAEWVTVGAGETCTFQFFPRGVVTGNPTMTVEWAVASW